MKRASIIIFALFLLAGSCAQEKGVSLYINNPLEQPRKDAIILLTRTAIEKWIQLPGDMVPLLIGPRGKPVTCQLDDLDRDGSWDELFGLIDIGAHEQVIVSLVPVRPDQFPSFEVRTNLRLGANQPGYPELKEAERLEGITYHNHGRTGEVYQMEGPAWENDEVGFRNYLDQRNGMDIFGKLTHQMVLDSVGIATRQSYHEPDKWGMDILQVGTSLGAGSIGYLYKDSIYRLGDRGSGTYSVVFEGPLRSRFNLTYDPWIVEGKKLKVVQMIEIIAGRHFYQSQVTISGTDNDFKLVPGIVNIKSDTLYTLDLNPQYTGLMTYDYQAEDTSLLAMALMVPKLDLISTGETAKSGDGVTDTYYVVLEADDQQPVPFRFYALWEKEDPRWASLEQKVAFLKGEADRWTQSVMIEVGH